MLCSAAASLCARAQSTEICEDSFKVDGREQAARFLDHANIGGSPDEIQRLIVIGEAAWLDEQFAAPASNFAFDYQQSDASLFGSRGSRV